MDSNTIVNILTVDSGTGGVIPPRTDPSSTQTLIPPPRVIDSATASSSENSTQNTRPPLSHPPASMYRSSPLASALVIPTFTGDNLSENVEKFLNTVRSVSRIEGWGPETIYEILVLKTEGSANYFVLNMSYDMRASLDIVLRPHLGKDVRGTLLCVFGKGLASMRQGAKILI
jgi:hypothetical protein